MKSYTLDEIKQVIKDANPRYFCLETYTGNRVIPFNTVKEKNSQDHVNKIFKYLGNIDLCPDGIYNVIISNSLTSKSRIAYSYIKGNPDINKIETAPKMEPQQKEIYSFEKLLTIHQELAEYKTKCLMYELELKNKDAEIIDLEDTISELESKNEGATGLSESGTMLAAKALQLFENFLIPQPAPLAEQTKAPDPVEQPKQNTKLTYQDILNLLQSNPDLVNRLSNDLNGKEVLNEDETNNGTEN